MFIVATKRGHKLRRSEMYLIVQTDISLLRSEAFSYALL